jgi:parallel beta-helix repeat protein
VLKTTDRTDNRDTIFITYSSFIVIDGLRSFSANRAAVRVSSSQRITIRNGVFGSNAKWGIFTDFSDDLLIENNECYGSVGEHGIYVSNSGDRPVVRGNRVHDNRASGIQLNADASMGGDGLITGALIERNVVYNNGVGGGGAINMDGVQTSTVRNNLLYNNHATGIVNYAYNGAAGPKGMEILNNTVYQASDGRYAVMVWRTAGPNRLRNNILYHPNAYRGSISYESATDVSSTDSDYNVITRVTPDDSTTLLTLAQWQAQGHEPHSITALPTALFVNAATNDFRLRTGSAAIDRGAALSTVTTDIQGAARPAGAGWDVGSYEGASGSGGTTGTLPRIAIADYARAEGNQWYTNYRFNLTLSAPSSSVVTVRFTTANGTAVGGLDFVAKSGAVTIPAGKTTAAISISGIGEALREGNETFTVVLSSPVNATIADATALGTILNDD